MISKSEHPFGAGPTGIPWAIRGSSKALTSFGPPDPGSDGNGIFGAVGDCALTATMTPSANERV